MRRSKQQPQISPPKGWRSRAALQTLILLIASIALVLVPAAVTFARPLSNLESSLIQGFGLLLGLAASYLFGKESARASAVELVQTHARPAFRRLLRLYSGLSGVANVVAKAQSEGRKREGQWTVLDVLEALMIQQISAASDAMEDWRDIVPEEVASIEEKARLQVDQQED